MKRAKRFATGLLVLAAIVFIVAHILIRESEPLSGWEQSLPYIRATAEAAMVGALADWFAVTALFRHPLGLPIPHTAIVKRRKDQIGMSLGQFVRENFMTRDVIATRLAEVNPARALSSWLQRPGSADLVAKQATAIIGGVVEVLDDDKISEVLEESLRSRIEAVSAAEVSAKVLDAALEANYHQRLFESTLNALGNFLDDNAEVFRDKFSEESPWWIPALVDDRVYNKVYSAVKDFIGEISSDPDHQLRHDFSSRMAGLRDSLDSSPEMQQKAEDWKQMVLEHPEVSSVIEGAWQSMKKLLLANVARPDSRLAQSLSGSVASFGEKLAEDAEMQQRVNEWTVSAAGYMADEFAEPVSEVITSTISTWDPDETADRLEAQVGKDLQFIRINGTIVGGLAGLIIFSLSKLI